MFELGFSPVNSNLLIILHQGMLLFVPAAGFGYVLWYLAGKPYAPRSQTLLGFGLAGFALHALLLQSFVYLGLPLHKTAGGALIVAFVGFAHGMWSGWKQRSLIRRGLRREIFFYSLVFAVAFAGQAAGLLAVGPARFFGNGHYDQANYVVTADFLAEEPFATKLEDVGYRPWLVRALEAKELRITECVVLGAVAVTSGCDSQEAYGTVNVFLLALAAVSTAAWLRGLSLPRWASACAGIGAALSPAFTRIYLDGFFSQTATLFVYPALAALLTRRGTMRREEGITISVLLAYLIGSYSEVSILGLGLVTASLLTSTGSWRLNCRSLSLITAGAFLLNPGYLSRLPALILGQMNQTAQIEALAVLFPEGGTWLGWGRMFMDLPVPALVVANGILIAGLGVLGVLSLRGPRRRVVAIAVGIAILPLLILRVMPIFSVYMFAKLMMHFVPVWIGMALMGWVVLLRRFGRRRLVSGLAWVWIAGMVGTTAPALIALVHPSGLLAVLSSDRLREVRAEVASHPGRAYFVAHDAPLVGQWLCYFGRHARVVFDRRNLGDRVVPTETYGFRRWLKPDEQLWWLDPVRTGPVIGYEPAPLVAVNGAVETGATGLPGRYYVGGSTLDFIVTRVSNAPSPRRVWLDLAFIPLYPTAGCRVELTNATGRTQRTVLSAPGWKRWELFVPTGESLHQLRFQSTSPAPAQSGLVIVKSISLEVATSLIDPAPVDYVEASIESPAK